MHDAAVVRVLKRAGHVAEDAEDLGRRERRGLAEAMPKRLAFDVRHCIEGQTARVARREYGDDVRLLERGCELDLPLEPLGADAGRELGREDLHDDLPAEPELVGEEDARHTTTAELTFDGVGSAEGRLELLANVRHRVRERKSDRQTYCWGLPLSAHWLGGRCFSAIHLPLCQHPAI